MRGGGQMSDRSNASRDEEIFFDFFALKWCILA